MPAPSCLEMGQMYWLVIAAASLASLSEWLLGGEKKSNSLLSRGVQTAGSVTRPPRTIHRRLQGADVR